MKTTELKEGQELLTEVPSEETGKLLTEIIPDEVKKEEELLTEEKDTSGKKSSKGPRVKKSTREIQPQKEAPPEVLEAIKKISEIELAKEAEAAAAETATPDSQPPAPIIITPVEPPVTEPPFVDIGTPPGPVFNEGEPPCDDRARRGFRFVKKKPEEYTPSERKSLLKNFSRRTLRTRYGIEF